MSNRCDPSKPGVLGKIRLAPSEHEVNSALSLGASFKSASDDTNRKWKKASTIKLASLSTKNG